MGSVFLVLNKRLIDKILIFFVSLSAGTLMGGAFLHLLPESLEKLPADKVFYVVLFSFVVFFSGGKNSSLAALP